MKQNAPRLSKNSLNVLAVLFPCLSAEQYPFLSSSLRLGFCSALKSKIKSPLNWVISPTPSSRSGKFLPAFAYLMTLNS